MRTLFSCTIALLACAALADEPPSQLAELLGSEADAGFARALEPRSFSFPADHGPHPAFRNEWWYVTGNLDGERGERFGFELTIFRFSLTPDVAPSASAWRTNQVYVAHLAVTDAGNERFLVAQRYSRGALGLAGARNAPLQVWIDDWRIDEQPAGDWRLVAQDEDFGIDFSISALKAPVPNGNNGLSQKSPDPGNASYYYSITRLATHGTLRVDDRTFEVAGLSWLDREWSTSALAADQAGWDWFALQLSDGTELMYYGLRRQDGSRDVTSGGTWVDAAGASVHLDRDDVDVSVLDNWDSPAGGRYPARWRIAVPARGLDIEIAPVIADQELFTTVRYWEGAVDVMGTRHGEPVAGRGYVELTGYAE